MATVYDVILITADEYVDHPANGVAIIKRVLEHNGFSVEVISKPDWKKNDDFLKFGAPKLFFGITSGPVDSMLNNYTALKKERTKEEYPDYNPMPDRAVTVYCNKIRELFSDSIIVIGGVEASLRRFAHYDYWQNRVRKSILLDTRADVLVYGNGEKQVIEIANRVKDNLTLIDSSGSEISLKKKEKVDFSEILGTCIITKHLPEHVVMLPDFELVEKDDDESKKKFCEMEVLFSIEKNVAQKYDKKYVVQYKYPIYVTSDLDLYYSFDYSRILPSHSQLHLAKFSITTHRGCIGRCNFCSIALHQGARIISRSEESILNEIRRITKHLEFNGIIEDIGGPSANMYGLETTHCGKNNCISCENLDRSHSKLISLLRMARVIPGVKKICIQSGIRYDLALHSKEYLEEISNHHIREYLMIAPEHFSSVVSNLMNKPSSRFDEFVNMFNHINVKTKKYLKYYFMVGHPGTTLEENKILALKAKLLKHSDMTQIFTPTPMTISTCMYWTSMNPYTLEKVYVPYSYIEKKKQKNMILIDKKD
ncbi:MAG: YgiQ family radical SAM protein [Candidatus Woesearchaeota archaeon]